VRRGRTLGDTARPTRGLPGALLDGATPLQNHRRMRWGVARATLATAVLSGALGAAGALGVLLAPSALLGQERDEKPRIYRWIDENGVAHYTTDPDRIPGGLRGPVRRDASVPDPAREAQAPAAEPEAAPREVATPTRRTPPTEVESWARRDRPTGVAEDVWSEGGAETPALAATAPAPSPQERAREEAVERERLDEIETRIDELEAEVAAHEDALKSFISAPESEGPLARSGDPEFRAIAERLPQHLAELRALREERASLETE